MSVTSIDQPVISSSPLRSVNFFNGRLLTGDDLRLEQSTARAGLERAARLAGSGVAYGFEVEASSASTTANPVVTIAAGLAAAPSGAALELSAAKDVSLASADPPPDAEPGGLFAECQPSAVGTYTAGSGVYLLAVGPAQQSDGMAQVSGLGNRPATCNVAYTIEALKFKLIRLAIDPAILQDTRLLRNRVAASCFDYDAIAGFVANPFGIPPTGYGLVDALRSQILSEDAVPLAVIGWSVDDGIQFVDMWSVRRRVMRATAEGNWGTLVAERRRAEAEAAFLQFQAHLRDVLLAGGALQTPVITDHFERLPPVGILPAGIDLATFFAQIKWRGPSFIEAARVEPLVRLSLGYAPIEVRADAFVWLYGVPQTLDPSGHAVSYALFTSGHVPYAASAQYDLAHSDYANYARHAH